MISLIISGFFVGIIARILSPGPNNPSGFILTIILGIVGAALATAVGQYFGFYAASGTNSTGAGWIASIIGALVVLFMWNRLVARGMIPDPGRRL